MARLSLCKCLDRAAFKNGVVLLATVLFLQEVHADVMPHRLVAPLPPTQRIFIDNINLTAREFFAAYMSKTVEERRYAELYLLGVLDSTEGASWCGYRAYKTTTIAEELYAGFQKLEKRMQDRRAAHVISDMLGKKFPCEGKSK